MTQNDGEWRRELEESAQGSDYFETPGSDIQRADAREEAVEFTSGSPDRLQPSGRVEKARTRRHSLASAMTELETVVSSPAAAEGWHQAVSDALDELRLALVEHIEVTEGEEGLLDEIIANEPRFATEVALIKGEHEELVDGLDRAFLTLEGTIDMASDDPEPIRRRVMTLLGRLSLHRQRGADLVYDAYNVDIATGD